MENSNPEIEQIAQAQTDERTKCEALLALIDGKDWAAVLGNSVKSGLTTEDENANH